MHVSGIGEAGTMRVYGFVVAIEVADMMAF